MPFISPSIVVEFIEHLLPDPQNLRFEHWYWEPDSHHLHITLASTQLTASCPVCGESSRRIHSRYDRTLQDLTLARGFAHLVRQRLPENLDPWLEEAAGSPLAQFQKFARSLQEDYAAVKAGVTLATSNGQVEGQINRLKMLKRQIYGRAGFNLLQRRVLLAS